MANVEFGTGKTVLILLIVVACFAVLWPKIFYPMLLGVAPQQTNSDSLEGCCEVLFETDINAFKIMTEVCGGILNREKYFNPKLTQAFQQGKLNKEMVSTCRKEVMDMCGIDIAEFLNKKDKLSKSYKQILDEIRSFNISLCLRQNFGINPGLLGAPRRMRIWSSMTPNHLRQERPLHFRPEMLHPALREKGRAIPQSNVPKTSTENDFINGPSPVTLTRPPMGGAGHVVSAPKNGGITSLIMPLYTIGIVIFFLYTTVKIFTKKKNKNIEYQNFQSDLEFERAVFSDSDNIGCYNDHSDEHIVPSSSKEMSSPQVWKSTTDDSTRLGENELDDLRKKLEETEKAMERVVAQLGVVPTALMTKTLNNLGTKIRSISSKPQPNIEEVYADGVRARKKKDLEVPEQVKVMGLELMAGCNGGKKWKHSVSPTLGIGSYHAKLPVIPDVDAVEPQNIYLEGNLPQASKLLVSDSKTQAFTIQNDDEQDSPVVLSSKMTLSLINCDAPLEENDCQNQHSSAKTESQDITDHNHCLTTDESARQNMNSGPKETRGETKNPSEREQEVPDSEPENNQHRNETSEEGDDNEDASTIYGTPTMSQKTDTGLDEDQDNTMADVSNSEVLDWAEEVNFSNEDVSLRNGNVELSKVECKKSEIEN